MGGESDARQELGVGLCLREAREVVEGSLETNRASPCSVPGRGVRGYVFATVRGARASAPHLLPEVQARKSFEDYGKKTIIAESVRTSSVEFSSEGSGLWLGGFVRPSLCVGFGCAILESGSDGTVGSVFDSIIQQNFFGHFSAKEPFREEEQREQKA